MLVSDWSHCIGLGIVFESSPLAESCGLGVVDEGVWSNAG